MKTKYWVLAAAALLAVCLGISAWFLMRPRAGVVEVWSGGSVIRTLDLSRPADLIVESPDGGTNHVVVRDGRVCVAEASCPDKICVHMGWQDGGFPIACLPNEMLLVFPADD